MKHYNLFDLRKIQLFTTKTVNDTVVKVLLILVMFFPSLTLLSQNEAKKWYFGYNAGLDFSTSPPTVLTNGALNTDEGSASISDAAGNILFYTDGVDVYNKSHVVMANGTGLFGDLSSTQSAIIVKQPGNTNIYFVFTQEELAGPDGFCYSTIDMSLAAGMGSVTIKNTLLHTPSCEKITAVRHCNGVDTWVVSHDWNSNNFRTYLVNSAGISTSPVISSVGAVVTNTGLTAYESLGQMKISPNGRKLGLAINNDPGGLAPFEMYDFDPSMGIVSNPVVLGTSEGNYGCEFSPDGTKFYGSRLLPYLQGGEIFQWNLCAGTAFAIAASKYTVTASSDFYGSLQVAPDGKIYIASLTQTLNVISNPNALGAACNLNSNGISVAPNSNLLGLPNFITSFFKPMPSFSVATSCQNVTFTPSPDYTTTAGCTASGYPVTGKFWNFGDPASGSSNTSTVNNPTHSYSGTGSYIPYLVVTTQCASDTFKMPITINASTASLSVAGTFTICKGDKKVYTASGANSYSWNTNANTAIVSLSPTITTSYTVTGTNTLNLCKSVKIFTVTVNTCTGLTNLEGGDYFFKVYPNPVSKQLILEADTKITITILNISGKIVLEGVYENGRYVFDMSDYGAGIYALKASSEKGSQTIRIVKSE